MKSDKLVDNLREEIRQKSFASRKSKYDPPEISYLGISTEHRSNVSRKEYMLNMLKYLKLEEFYPSKISLPMITEIEKSTDAEVNVKSIAFQLLRKFMNLNYKGREEDLNTLYECPDDEDFSDFSDGRSDESDIRLHPLDVFLLTFLCCDPILQQELVSKMFFCRVAVPFIYRTIDEKLIMSKWAYRKIVFNRKKEDKWVEDDALSQYVKTVSFIRIGPQTFSKSNMINEILSDQKHSTFFNRNTCTSFEAQRLIADGLVEASWFIPSNSSCDDSVNIFEDVAMFLNLRGNCVEYEEETKMLCSISDLLIVSIDVNILNQPKSVKQLEKIHSFDKFMIYAIECRKGDTNRKAEVNYFKSKCAFNMLKKEKTKFRKIESEISFSLIKNFRRNISEYLSKETAKRFSEVISNITFTDDRFSVDGYSMAKDITDFIDKQKKLHGCALLPLQGPQWARLCQCTKDLYRSKSEDDQVKLKIDRRKIKLDLFKLINESQILHKFEQNLLQICFKKESEHENLFFIAWMKSFIDERLRTVRPDFEAKYKKLRLKIKVSTEKNNRVDIDKYSKKLKEINRNFNTTALCYEHFIREMGHAFMIQNELPGKIVSRTKYENFPSFVSKMLQYGYPFEVMDGDTGMVNLPWVNAVLQQLKEDIGDKTIYAISVLGIQSSGKSTLLNTMFGLDFAVSAGRCTRGVFMQLIKVTDHTLPFDYLLILDTEGIRASAYEKDRRAFENELATFAIGLGNITILNIKGENTSEIEDFLQIAVHACLRLKMANKNIKMHQTCVFVHQNVCAHDAEVKLQEQRETLMHRLDKMVKDAALHEDRSDIYSFIQVIGIDIETDVWYFPDLWQGEPPMATVTLGYSSKVSSLKKHILYNIAKSQCISYSITDTMTRVKDIWRGILTDDFVFSFRNGLEIKAYREMESFFHRLTWKLECEVDECISSSVSEKIARCPNDADLETVCNLFSTELSKKIRESFSIRRDELDEFLNNSRFKHLLEQYKESRTIQLEEFQKKILQKITRDINFCKSRHKSSLLQIAKMTKHKKELKIKAHDLVTKCKGDELSDVELTKHFNEMWDKWIDGIESSKYDRFMSVEKIIENKLFELFSANIPLLQKEIEATKVQQDRYRRMEALVDSIELNDLNNDHVTPSSPIGIDQTEDMRMKTCMRGAFNTINLIMKKLDTYISSLQTEYLLFKESYATKVFMIMIESLESNNSNENNSFRMTVALRAKLAVHIKMYIVKVFMALNDEFREKNDMKKQMQSEKQKYLDDFIGCVKNKTIEMRMANLFSSKVESFIKETVSVKLPSDVVTSIIPDTFNTKYSLMIKIMTQLVRKSDFNEFMQYIDDSGLYALDWLTKYINTSLFEKSVNDQKNRYEKIAETHVDKIYKKIKQSIAYATEQIVANVNDESNCKKHRISVWSTIFEEHLSRSFTVTKGTFLVDIGDEIIEIPDYVTLLIDCLKASKKIIKDQFKSHNAQNVKWIDSPYNRTFCELWGCIEQCPFCKESCQKRANHRLEAHSCIQHRPPAVCGVRNVHTKEMQWMPCNCLVVSGGSFYCNASSNKCQSLGKCEGKDGTTHPYRNYSTLIPDWIIEPIPLHEPPDYWIWFISTYQKELCEAYNYKIHEHIDEWKGVSDTDAISSLTRI